MGGHVADIRFDGINQSGRIEQLRSDSTLARLVDFSGGSRLAERGYETALFVQGAWSLGSSTTLDAGLRYDDATIARDGALAPRVAVTWKIARQTTLSSSAGVFSDKVMLATAAFPLFQSRLVSEFDTDGLPAGPARRFANILTGQLRMPRADAWHLQLDRRFDNGLIARIAYQNRAGRYEPIVNTVLDRNGTEGSLVLSSTGRSRARSLETTLGYRSSSTTSQSIYVSYVRASSVGNLNDFASVEGNFKDPFVEPDEVGPLRVDVPNRLLAWGLFKLPSRVTVAPFVEIRNGFPFSPIDDEWRFAGPRNAARFPMFASVDLFVNKIVKLPVRLPLARVGLKFYNLTGAKNSRDIQRDIARGDFGATYNPIPREIRGVFELLWGKK